MLFNKTYLNYFVEDFVKTTHSDFYNDFLEKMLIQSDEKSFISFYFCFANSDSKEMGYFFHIEPLSYNKTYHLTKDNFFDEILNIKNLSRRIFSFNTKDFLEIFHDRKLTLSEYFLKYFSNSSRKLSGLEKKFVEQLKNNNNFTDVEFKQLYSTYFSKDLNISLFRNFVPDEDFSIFEDYNDAIKKDLPNFNYKDVFHYNKNLFIDTCKTNLDFIISSFKNYNTDKYKSCLVTHDKEQNLTLPEEISFIKNSAIPIFNFFPSFPFVFEGRNIKEKNPVDFNAELNFLFQITDIFLPQNTSLPFSCRISDFYCEKSYFSKILIHLYEHNPQYMYQFLKENAWSMDNYVTGFFPKIFSKIEDFLIEKKHDVNYFNNFINKYYICNNLILTNGKEISTFNYYKNNVFTFNPLFLSYSIRDERLEDIVDLFILYSKHVVNEALNSIEHNNNQLDTNNSVKLSVQICEPFLFTFYVLNYNQIIMDFSQNPILNKKPESFSRLPQLIIDSFIKIAPIIINQFKKENFQFNNKDPIIREFYLECTLLLSDKTNTKNINKSKI